MIIKEGDPILSRDGSRIAAYWAKSITLKHGNSILLPFMRAPMASMTYADTPEPEIPERRTIEIVAHFEAPDRTYWRENSFGDVDGWEKLREWFREVPGEPGPSPAGMVAAYDLILEQWPFHGASSMTIGDLERARVYWVCRAKTLSMADRAAAPTSA